MIPEVVPGTVAQDLVRIVDRWADGTSVDHGIWVRTWVQVPGTQSWILVSCIPTEAR